MQSKRYSKFTALDHRMYALELLLPATPQSAYHRALEQIIDYQHHHNSISIRRINDILRKTGIMPKGRARLRGITATERIDDLAMTIIEQDHSKYLRDENLKPYDDGLLFRRGINQRQ